VFLVNYGSAISDFRVFRGEPSNLRNVSGIISEAVSWHSRGLIQFGLLLLIAVPVARVTFSVVAFALQKDRTYVVVTLIVLTILMYSLTGAGP
jgi:uncharacterized membrane protein